jgi:hypothetical protein
MKRNGIKLGILGVLALTTTFANARAETTQSTATDVSYRMEHRLGLYIGYDDPAPATVGINAAYNITDFLRASIGWGKETVTTGISLDQNGVSTTEATENTIGIAAKAMMPGWNLTPTLGLGWAHVALSGAGNNLADGFSGDGGSHVYFTGGADYQAKSGLNAAAGVRTSLKSGVGTSVYVTAGWFVDWI